MEPWLRAVFAKAKGGDYPKARLIMQEQRLVFAFFEGRPWPADEAGSADAADGAMEPELLDARPLYIYPAYMNFRSFHYTGLRVYDEVEDVLQIPKELIPDIAGVVQVGPLEPDPAGSNHGVFSDLEFVRGLMNLENSWQLRMYCISLTESHWQQEDRSSSIFPLVDAADECAVEAVWLWRGSEYESAQRRASRKVQQKKKRPASSRQPTAAAKGKHAKKRPEREDISKTDAAHEADVPADGGDGVPADAILADPTGDLYADLPSDADADPAQESEPDALAGFAGTAVASSDKSASCAPSVGGESVEEEEEVAPRNLEDPDLDDVDDMNLEALFAGIEELFPAERPERASGSGDRPTAVGPVGQPAAVPPISAEAEGEAAEPAVRHGSGPGPGHQERRADFSKDELIIPHLGKIRHYRHQKALVAVCTHPGHGDCRLYRTVEPPPPARVGRPGSKGYGQGRPLGLLMSWLKKQFDCSTHREHMACKPDLESREQARTELRGLAGAAQFFEAERPLREADREPDEPAAIR